MFKGETVLSGAKHPGTELQVVGSAAGFYVGFKDEDGFAYSRESLYFHTRQEAEALLRLLRAGNALDANIELLRENVRMRDDILRRQHKEIERLNCALTISRGKHENAIAEIERLRAALRLIADPGDVTTAEELGYIAHAALEGEK